RDGPGRSMLLDSHYSSRLSPPGQQLHNDVRVASILGDNEVGMNSIGSRSNFVLLLGLALLLVCAPVGRADRAAARPDLVETAFASTVSAVSAGETVPVSHPGYKRGARG